MMPWIRRLFLILCVVLTGLLIWAGVYARKQGFTRSWRDAIEREFASRGYHVHIGKLTLGAFRGLVAEDVIFYETERRLATIAYVDDVYLDVDLSRIFRKEVSVNTLDVEDARLSLPLGSRGGRLQVLDFSGRVIVTESMIEIVSASATVEGVEMRVKGTLVKAAKSDDESEEGEGGESEIWNERRRQLLGAVEVLREFEFFGDRPVITVDFRGDLEDFSNTTVDLVIEAADFRKRGQSYEFAELSAVVRYDGREETVALDSFTLRDRGGELTGSATWSIPAESVAFEVDSTADLSSLLELFEADPKLREIVFFRSPTVRAEGEIDLSRWGESGRFPGRILGEFRSDRFVTRGRVFDGIELGFSAEAERFYLRNLRLDHGSGVAFLNLKFHPGLGPETVQYQTEIKLDPHIFRPFLDESGREFLDAWSFSENSTVYLAAAGRGEGWDVSTWENRGVVDLRNFRLNGVEFEEMEADFESQAGDQWFRGVKLEREEGEIVAELAHHHVGKKLWEVKGVHSTVDLVEGAAAFSPALARQLASYRFSRPPSVRLEGALDARTAGEVGDEPRRTDLVITFESDAPAEYDFLGKTLTVEPSTGRIRVDRSRVHLTELTAGAFCGGLELSYDATDVRSSRRPFVARLRVDDIPLEAITKTYNDSDSVRGQISGELQLRGNASDIASLQGEGIARIENGNLFAIPVLGPLSKIIEKASPNREDAGHSVAREAYATAVIENGVLRTDDLVAYADSFRVRSAGSISLVTKEVDLEAVIGARDDLSRTILTPVSELLTYSCTGTVSEPVWKPKHISNLGKLPAQVLTEMTKVPAEGIRAIGKGLFGERRANSEGEVGGAANPPEAEAEAESPSRTPILDRLRAPRGGDD